MNKPNIKPIKAEITVVFKTCDLIDYDEFQTQYQGGIEKLVKDLLKKFSLSEIVENEGIITDIKLSDNLISI